MSRTSVLLSKIWSCLASPSEIPVADRSEGAAIALLEGTGLDWRTSLKELATRHGKIERYGREVVALPPISTLSGEPLTLYAPYVPEIEDHPASHATTTFLLYDEALRNHEEIVSRMRRMLGQGMPGRAASTLHEEWRFGRIVISATTWPPERQLSGSVNWLHELEPRLRFATTINIQSDLTYIFPLADLTEVFESPGTRFLEAADTLGVVASPSPGPGTRVNPISFKDRIREGEWRVWRNEGLGRAGHSHPATTAVTQRGAHPTLHPARLAPARGPGRASIRVETGRVMGSASVFQSETTHGLDVFADRLAAFWELPLSTSVEQDD